MWLPGLQLAALWPHWVWMARRTVDGSDEPWGIVALLTIIVLVMLDRKRMAAQPSGAALLAAGSLALAAAACVALLPPIVGGGLAVLAVAALLAGMLPAERPRLPLALLALLVLPLAASLNFYAGYPLRWVCAHGSAFMLSLAGMQVTPEGAALLWNGRTILVDAPCAGIAMLWVGLYAAALMSYLHRASPLRFACNTVAAAGIVVAGNTVRNAALFFKEAGITRLPDWTHDGIGLAIFAASFYLIYHLLSWRPHACR
jgi:exosortase/archaeosortase family protein